eukprot:TRINITY_DN1109_c2_g1_i1.p1 TRINITY_DN1109_c2_g1~~TRINITY_DN1109_c2_g1_i1.p1  ORF type:complete len:294 (-),score=84.76 TRINITY_DN1109_c2_g1_i1:208-1089(-)
MASPRPAASGFVVVLLALAGLAISCYLAFDHYDDTEHSFCDFGSHISCTKVKNSVWAELFNVPVAVFGVGWFVVLMLFSVCAVVFPTNGKSINYYANAIFFWSLFGTVFVFYLVFAEIVLSTICPMCTVIHVITLIVLFLSWKQYDAQPRRPTIMEMFIALQKWVIGIALLNLLIIVYFNMPSAPTQLGPSGDAPLPPEFGQCIAREHWKIYGVTGCSYCEAQKKLLGDAVLVHAEFVDCAIVDCSPKGLRGYPTWIQEKDGEELARWTGYASLQNIEAFTGCSVAQPDPTGQ